MELETIDILEALKDEGDIAIPFEVNQADELGRRLSLLEELMAKKARHEKLVASRLQQEEIKKGKSHQLPSPSSHGLSRLWEKKEIKLQLARSPNKSDRHWIMYKKERRKKFYSPTAWSRLPKQHQATRLTNHWFSSTSRRERRR